MSLTRANQRHSTYNIESASSGPRCDVGLRVDRCVTDRPTLDTHHQCVAVALKLVEFVHREECVMLMVAVGSATGMGRHSHAATRAVLVQAAPDTAFAESKWAAADLAADGELWSPAGVLLPRDIEVTLRADRATGTWVSDALAPVGTNASRRLPDAHLHQSRHSDTEERTSETATSEPRPPTA
jgi:hypothetical protein